MIYQGAYGPSTPHWTHKNFKPYFGSPLAPNRTTYLEGPAGPLSLLSGSLQSSVLVTSPPDAKVPPTMQSSSERLLAPCPSRLRATWIKVIQTNLFCFYSFFTPIGLSTYTWAWSASSLVRTRRSEKYLKGAGSPLPPCSLQGQNTSLGSKHLLSSEPSHWPKENFLYHFPESRVSIKLCEL